MYAANGVVLYTQDWLSNLTASSQNTLKWFLSDLEQEILGTNLHISAIKKWEIAHLQGRVHRLDQRKWPADSRILVTVRTVDLVNISLTFNSSDLYCSQEYSIFISSNRERGDSDSIRGPTKAAFVLHKKVHEKEFPLNSAVTCSRVTYCPCQSQHGQDF